MVKRFKSSQKKISTQRYLWGGAVVQMQHKHMEGYLDSEGEEDTGKLSLLLLLLLLLLLVLTWAGVGVAFLL